MPQQTKYPPVKRIERPDPSAKAVRAIKRAVLAAERLSGDGKEIGGTGQTVIRLKAAPLQRLIERDKIGAEELRAAEEIRTVFEAKTGALMIRPQSLERRDRSHNGEYEPVALIDGMQNYRNFADHWSMKAESGHPLLEIVIQAIIDEWPFRQIDAVNHFRKGKGERVVIAGLRDYAARAGWVTGRIAAAWFLEASSLFRTSSPDLRMAIHKANRIGY